MNWELKNDKISIKVKSMGAELSSIYSIDKKRELLWQGDAAYWTGQSPVLFPIVGGLKDGFYLYKGKQYRLPRHGLARRREFELVSVDDDSIELVLNSDEETKELYPFDFELHVGYQLIEDGVEITYKVVNKTDGVMYFSIGAHPAFNVDVDAGDAVLVAEESVDLSSYKMDVDKGLLYKEKFQVFESSDRVDMNFDWFKNDTLIFDSMALTAMSLFNRKSGDTIMVVFENFPYLGIWTPNAPFLCIEPWHGVADFVNGNHRLVDKAGIERLEKGGVFSCLYKIEYIS